MRINAFFEGLFWMLGLGLWACFMLLGSCSVKEEAPQPAANDTLALLEGEWACVDAYWKHIGTGQRVENDPRLPPLRRDYWIVRNGEVRRYPMIGYEHYPMGPSMSRPFRITVDWGRLYVNYFWGGQWMCGIQDDRFASIPQQRISPLRHLLFVSSFSGKKMVLRGFLKIYSNDPTILSGETSIDIIKESFVNTYVFEKQNR